MEAQSHSICRGDPHHVLNWFAGRRNLGNQRSRRGRVVILVVSLVGWVGCTPPREPPLPRVAEVPVRRPVARPRPPVQASVRPAAALPKEQTVVLGRSVQGKPIEMTVFGQDGETILILGALHGNEPTSAALAERLIQYLQANPQTYQGRRVAVVPVVNPDGLALGTRENANGVDINRNFPANNFPADPGRDYPGGPYAVSERETLAVLTATRQLQPARIVSIHAIRRGEHGNNYDGPARSLAAEMGRHNGYPVLATMGYPTPGSFGTWAGIDQQIPTITLELPRDAGEETCWQENRDALLAAIRYPAGVGPTHFVGRLHPGGTGVGK